MSIDVEPKDLRKVVQLVANSEGWSRNQTRYNIDLSQYIGGNPQAILNQTPAEFIEAFQRAWFTTQEKRPTDFNGPKVAVTELAVQDGILSTKGVRTDYFTLWGLPQAAKELFTRHEAEVVINRATRLGDALYKANLPWGLCTHNLLLDKNGDVFGMVRSRSQGFHSGRLSTTEEEQTETFDSSAFATSARSFWEELRLRIPQKRVRLLGVAEEKGGAYPAYAFVTETDLTPKKLVERWRKAKDYNENTALLLIPMTQIDTWVNQDQDKINPQVWGPHLVRGNITPDAIIQLHPTSSWRMSLAREYSYLAK